MNGDSEYIFKPELNSIPFTRVDTNVYENSPNLIQYTHSIIRNNIEDKREISNSSNDEYYEASPVLEEAIYFPSLLEETNLPTVTVRIEPHMDKPLVDCPLNFLEIKSSLAPITKPRLFPLGNEFENKDESILLKIMEYEMDDEVDKRSGGWFSWFSRQDPWKQLFIDNTNDDDAIDDIDNDSEITRVFAQDEVYLDQIFTEIYNL